MPDQGHAILPVRLVSRQFGRAVVPDGRRQTAAAGTAKSGAAGPAQWSSFWDDVRPDGKPHERCYVPPGGREPVDRHWLQLAESLPRNAQVLDLGCGAGVLGRILLSRRIDLHVTGVDFAGVPVVHQPNLTIRRWVKMEDLPFPDSSFDAAISLFGIEYADIAPTATELGRVLRPGAPFSFLVHHQDSDTLREGSLRRRVLLDLFSGRMMAAFLAGNAEAVERLRRKMAQQFGDEPSLKLFGDHLQRQTGGTRAERYTMWQRLTGDLEPELALLLHLECSAKSAAGLGAWLVPMLSIMTSVRASVLRQRSGQPIAWEVSGAR